MAAMMVLSQPKRDQELDIKQSLQNPKPTLVWLYRRRRRLMVIDKMQGTPFWVTGKTRSPAHPLPIASTVLLLGRFDHIVLKSAFSG